MRTLVAMEKEEKSQRLKGLQKQWEYKPCSLAPTLDDGKTSKELLPGRSNRLASRYSVPTSFPPKMAFLREWQEHSRSLNATGWNGVPCELTANDLTSLPDSQVLSEPSATWHNLVKSVIITQVKFLPSQQTGKKIDSTDLEKGKIFFAQLNIWTKIQNY